MVARKRCHTNKQCAPAVVPLFTVADVVAAVEDLYVDELKPTSKLLRKRVF